MHYNYLTTLNKIIQQIKGKLSQWCNVLCKFHHYLLGNKFTFYVEHMALLYLVQNPQILGRLTKWLLFFLEYDFSVIYKLGKSHFLANALS
jgi:hypothetical protein